MSKKQAFFSIGNRDGRYMRCGRVVLWWYGFRRGSELLAVWRLDAGFRSAISGFALKPPWCRPLYSEGHGSQRPYVKLFGWRLVPIRYDK